MEFFSFRDCSIFISEGGRGKKFERVRWSGFYCGGGGGEGVKMGRIFFTYYVKQKWRTNTIF